MDQSKLRKRCFISSSLEDLNIARRIKEDLKKYGFEIELDNGGIIAETKRNKGINETIQQSIAVLYLVSPASRHSLHTDPDLEYAKICKKNIIPLWVRGDTEWDKVVAPDLFRTEHFDLRGGMYEIEIKRLIPILNNLSDSDVRFTRYIDYVEEADVSSGPREVRRILLQETPPNIPKEKLPRTNAFISYSHKDKDYLEELQSHLKHFVRQDRINVWDDTKIPPGSKWRDELECALQSAKIAVFLVSVNFFASDFIIYHELSPLLKAAEQGDVIPLSVILRACPFADSKLAQYQAINRPSQPLISMPPDKQDELWYSLAKRISETLKDQPG